MSKINLLIYTLAILIPIILFYTTYKLSKLRDYNRIQKKKLHRLMYLVSIVVLLLNGGFYFSIQQYENQSKQEIRILNQQVENLKLEYNQLQQESFSLMNNRNELTKENREILENNNGLSTKLQELKSEVSKKELQITELTNMLETHELSAAEIKIK
ncbi:MAG: hypothetical protein WAO52_06405 [Prolixibacteraceae bacterium]